MVALFCFDHLCISDNMNRMFFITNILGLIDSNEDYVVKYKYNAWGKLLSKEVLTECIASLHNPFIYKGYYYDEETGFYYLNARYYAPEWMRFISPDSIDYLEPSSITGLNLYAYCKSDPVNMYDPSGKVWMSVI